MDVKNAIRDIVDEIKKMCIIENTAIRDDIFGILENQCTVVYFPISDKKNRGFHIKRIVGNQLEDFVYINTNKPVAEQIFAAAHELGHIFRVAERVWKLMGKSGKPTEQEEEEITNLFAAELLMPDKAFRKNFFAHMNELEISPGKVRMDEVIRLIVCEMGDFMVPYEAVRRRLVETNIMDEHSANLLEKQSAQAEELVKAYLSDQNTYLGKGTGVRTISGLRTLLEKAEKKPGVDQFLIQKLKMDFEVKEIKDNNFEIHIEGDDSNHEQTGGAG